MRNEQNQQSTKPYRVLLYYKFVPIEDHEQFAEDHLQFCTDLGLKGRILVAHEGLNGTVSGTIEQTQKYMDALHADPRFADMEFKIDEADGHAFKKMHVRPRDEIITLRRDDIDPNEVTGEHLKPQDFYEELQKEDVLVIDGRNDYEYDIGHFRGAIRPDIEAFRDFPQWIEENLSEEDKDKRILTYCTGGIRCEKLTGYLKKEGFDNVAQLEGGIIKYSQDPEVKGRLFDGKCYVFDERISVRVNQTEEDVVIGECYYCGKKEDRYVNCANPECNRQHICCEECEHKYKRSCSKECREHERNRYELELEEQRPLEEQQA